MENLAQEWFLAYFSYEIQEYLLFKQTTEKNNRYQKQALSPHVYVLIKFIRINSAGEDEQRSKERIRQIFLLNINQPQSLNHFP